MAGLYREVCSLGETGLSLLGMSQSSLYIPLFLIELLLLYRYQV